MTHVKLKSFLIIAATVLTPLAAQADMFKKVSLTTLIQPPAAFNSQGKMQDGWAMGLGDGLGGKVKTHDCKVTITAATKGIITNQEGYECGDYISVYNPLSGAIMEVPVIGKKVPADARNGIHSAVTQGVVEALKLQQGAPNLYRLVLNGHGNRFFKKLEYKPQPVEEATVRLKAAMANDECGTKNKCTVLERDAIRLSVIYRMATGHDNGTVAGIIGNGEYSGMKTREARRKELKRLQTEPYAKQILQETREFMADTISPDRAALRVHMAGVFSFPGTNPGEKFVRVPDIIGSHHVFYAYKKAINLPFRHELQQDTQTQLALN